MNNGFCSKCGTQIVVGTSFCGKCGNPVNNQNMNNVQNINSNTGKLIISRENNFYGCAANLDVFINGVAYRLSNGGRYEFDLAPGMYNIEYKAWCRRKKSVQVSLMAGNYCVVDFGPDYLWGGFKPTNRCKYN